MARPTVPRIDRAEVVATALAIIDRDGLDGFNLRKIGRELDVNPASLYHHFRDKDAILHGVRMLVIDESHLTDAARPDESWQDHLRRLTIRYRRALLRHPNAVPLMAPDILLRPFSLSLRDHLAETLLTKGVPRHLVLALIDHVEGLVYASALLNPGCLAPRARLPVRPSDDVPSLARAIAGAPRSAERLFALELDATIAGWSVLVDEATR